AEHLERGALKYAARNWEGGQPLSWFLDSGGRHVVEWAQQEAGEDSLTAAAWNLLAALETRERIKAGLLPEALDDLPLEVKQPQQAMSQDVLDLMEEIQEQDPLPVEADVTPLPESLETTATQQGTMISIDDMHPEALRLHALLTGGAAGRLPRGGANAPGTPKRTNSKSGETGPIPHG
ncbi:MAG: DUF5664 domain-containing protein, partial [Acidobacteria bacterium]|nr:DUF5664 domain-containing protein [Acidobacteriota bacterium]